MEKLTNSILFLTASFLKLSVSSNGTSGTTRPEKKHVYRRENKSTGIEARNIYKDSMYLLIYKHLAGLKVELRLGLVC